MCVILLRYPPFDAFDYNAVPEYQSNRLQAIVNILSVSNPEYYDEQLQFFDFINDPIVGEPIAEQTSVPTRQFFSGIWIFDNYVLNQFESSAYDYPVEFFQFPEASIFYLNRIHPTKDRVPA